MKSARIISGILFYLSRALAWGYLITSIYASLALIFKNNFLNISGEGQRFEILYPFTNKTFLLGNYTTSFIIEMLSALGLYGIFFWMLSNVFKTFKQERLFTYPGIKYLTQFYTANLTVPLLMMILLNFISTIETPMHIIVVLHGIIGVFAYFMTAIFKQGVTLQNEQDLYI